MNYSEAVAQAAAALVRGDDSNWELARLTWENTQTRHKESDRATMADWCTAVREQSGRRFSEATGVVYRAIWDKYSHLGRDTRPTWTEAYFDIKGPMASTYTEARTAIERKTIERIETIATPEQKREVVSRLLADPEVADAIIQQPDTRHAVYGAMHRREQQAEVRRQNIAASDPILRRIDKETALLDLEQLLRKFAEQARELVATIGALPERSPGAIEPHLFLKQSFVAAEDALGGVRTLIETGTSDINNFLNSVLRGEQ